MFSFDFGCWLFRFILSYKWPINKSRDLLQHVFSCRKNRPTCTNIWRSALRDITCSTKCSPRVKYSLQISELVRFCICALSIPSSSSSLFFIFFIIYFFSKNYLFNLFIYFYHMFELDCFAVRMQSFREPGMTIFNLK